MCPQALSECPGSLSTTQCTPTHSRFMAGPRRWAHWCQEYFRNTFFHHFGRWLLLEIALAQSRRGCWADDWTPSCQRLLLWCEEDSWCPACGFKSEDAKDTGLLQTRAVLENCPVCALLCSLTGILPSRDSRFPLSTLSVGITQLFGLRPWTLKK